MSNSPQCLVVARDELRLQMLSSAALNGGWRTISCTDADCAITECEWLRIQLAIVDLEDSGPQPNRLWNLLEYLEGIMGLLVIVCGHQGDSRQEIRCRQFGAWVFLPGVRNGRDLTQVLLEANRIVMARDLKADRWVVAT